MKFTSVKVSNNALNFLLAQYRAIFKRAYIKGIATAVLMTAGLAAGAASGPAMAAVNDTILDAEDFSSGAAVSSGTITQSSTINMGLLDADKFSGTWTVIGDTVLSGPEAYITITGAAGKHILVSGSSGNLTVQSGASLTINNTDTTDTHIYGGNTDGSSGTLTLTGDGSTINLNKASMGFKDVKINNGAELNLGGQVKLNYDSGSGAWYTYSNISAGASGTFSVENAKVNVNDQGFINAETLNVSGATTINLNGEVKDVTSGSDYATAFLKAYGDSGTITFASTTANGTTSKPEINVTADKYGALYATKVNLTDTQVNIGAGATLIIDGTFSDTAAANEGVHKTTTLTLDDVTFDNNGTAIIGNPSSGGTATVQSGTTTLTTGNVKNYAQVTIKGTDSGSGAATLVVSADQLTKEEGKGEGWFAGHSGSITISGAAADTAILEIQGTDSNGLNLNTDLKLTSGDSVALGQIGVSGNGTIKGERLVLAEKLNVDASNNLKLEATDHLTLGSSTYTGTASMGISGATARNLTLQGSGNSFTLADAVTVAAIDEVDNPFLTEKGTLKVAADGQLNLEDKTTITGTNGLTIAAGNYKSNADITIKSGALTVGNQTTATDEGYGVDASLALSGKLTLDNSTGANTITVAGNGDLTIKTDDSGTNKIRPATSTLNLTGVDKVTITRGDNNTTFNVNGGGELLLSTNAFNSIINNVANASTSNSGAEVVVSGGGYVYVEGSVQDYTGSKALDVAKLTSGSTTGTDRIRFSGDGTLEARDTIWLEAQNGTSALNIGSGELQAQTFRLDGKGTTADDKTTYAAFKVESGILTAGARVESSHDNDIQLGNGTDSGATLNLGYIEDDVDEWGQKTGTFTTSSATGSVDTNLVLSGAAGSKSALNVDFGDWTAKDITVTQGSITVGDTDTHYDADHNEVVYNASLTGNKLTLGTGAEATVNSNGKATFNELTMTAGTLTVNGEMLVKGNHVLANNETSTPESWGVNLTAGTIDVTGRNARLTFGGDAVSAISIDSDNKGVTVKPDTFGQTIAVTDFAILGLNFAEGTTFNADTLQSLRTALLSNSTNGAALTDGYINLGSAKIEGVTVTDGTIDWNQLKDFADIDQLQDIITDDMSNATLVNANGTDTVQGNVGNIQLDGNQQTVKLGDAYLANASSNNENGNFVFNETNPAQAGNANIVGGAHVTFANGGNVGAVSLATGTANGGETIFNVVSQDPAAETNITNISAGDNTLVNISAITNVAQGVTANDLQVDSALNVTGNVDLSGDLTDSFDTTGAANGTLTAANLDVNGETAYHGNLDITGSADFGSAGVNGETYLGGNNKFATRVTFNNSTELERGTTEAGRVVLNGNAASLDIIGDAVLNAQVVDAAAGQTIHVGEESSTDVGYTGDEPWESSAGYFFAERVDLNGATIMADPAFGKAASMVGIGQLGDTAAITSGNDAGTLNGQVIALRNAIMAIGVSDTEEATVREQLQGTFAQYLDANGSLDADGVGSILYVAEALNVDNGSKLIVDSKRSFTTYANDSAQKATGAYGNKIDQNDVYIGENSALALGEAAALTATYNNAPRAALDFDKTGASLYAEKNAKILLVGSDFSIHSDIHLFSDNDGGIMINGNNVTVSTMNNLLIDTLEQGKEAGSIKLSLNRDAVGSAFYAASTPVKNTLIAYAANDLNWADTSDKHVSQQLLGDRVANVTWDGTNFKTKEGDNERVLTAEESADLTYDVVGYNEKDQPIYGVFEKGYNYFLDQVARDSKSGSEAETVARLGVYGGAPQAAIKAGQSSTDAIAARFGIGSAISNLTVAGNTQGAALWGEGAASSTSNDFDYYGFGAYAGYTMGQFSVVGDISYTVADNEIEANTAVDRVGATMDSTNLSLGVTGKYELSFNGVNVTPHVGLRYSNIDLDDYTIDGEEVVGSADSDKLNLFSIPVGVTIAKEFKGESWTVAPSFDLTLTGQFGDDELDGSVNWAGISNMTTDTTTEVFDNFTYGATLGVEAQSVGGIALGINVKRIS